MDTARALADELAAKSPIALRLAKESMNRVEYLPLKEAYRTEQDYTARLSTFEDAAEARQAASREAPARLEVALTPRLRAAVAVSQPLWSRHPGELVARPLVTAAPMKFFWASTVPAPKHRPRMSR